MQTVAHPFCFQLVGLLAPVFAGISEGEVLREVVAILHAQPLLVVCDVRHGFLRALHERVDDLDFFLGGEGGEVVLRGVLEPVAAPVVVGDGGVCKGGRGAFENAGGAGIRREGEVHEAVETEAAQLKISTQPAPVVIFLADDAGGTLLLQVPSCRYTGDPGTQDEVSG